MLNLLQHGLHPRLKQPPMVKFYAREYDHFAIMMHISASTAPICVKQKLLYSKMNAESDKNYYNSLSLENPLESLQWNVTPSCEVFQKAQNQIFNLVQVRS